MGDIKKSADSKTLDKQQRQDDLDLEKGIDLALGDSADNVGSSREIGETEVAHLQGLDRNLNEHVLNHLEIRYSRWLPPERLAAERQRIARIEPKEDLQQNLRENFPDIPAAERQAVLGYCSGDERHIERNMQTPSTLLHERLHGLSHPEAKSVLGNHLYEGLTEDLATGNPEFYLKLKDTKVCYPENLETVKLLRARMPESALYDAYFKGDDRRIKDYVDGDLGDGAWDRVRELLQQAEDGNQEALQEAKRILGLEQFGNS